MRDNDAATGAKKRNCGGMRWRLFTYQEPSFHSDASPHLPERIVTLVPHTHLVVLRDLIFKILCWPPEIDSNQSNPPFAMKLLARILPVVLFGVDAAHAQDGVVTETVRIDIGSCGPSSTVTLGGGSNGGASGGPSGIPSSKTYVIVVCRPSI